MNTQAALFRKVHEPLTVESVEIDKPWGREVLVRTAATGVCHSDLHVVDASVRFIAEHRAPAVAPLPSLPVSLSPGREHRDMLTDVGAMA